MFDEDVNPDQSPELGTAGLLDELERNTPDELRRQRSHFRVSVHAAVFVQPGNSSELLTLKLQCVTGDVSESGCRILTPLPLKVGDIYRLAFEPADLPLPLTFARCMRCQLLREDAYDCGFRFFNTILLPETLVHLLDENA